MIRRLRFFILIGVLGLPPGLVAAQAPPASSWLKSEPPVFNKLISSVPDELVPIYADRPCLPQTKFVTIPGSILKSRAEVSHKTCAVPTAYGQHSTVDGSIKLSGTDLSGQLKTANNARFIQPIPNSRHVMYANGGLYGTYRYIIKNLSENSSPIVQPDGSLVHQIKPGVSETGLKDSAGNLIALNETYYSNNAKWLVSDVNQIGMHRINIETGESLIFQTGYNHANGARPRFISAISGDGRFVAVTEKSYQIFRLYDLNTCVRNADPAKAAVCQFKDLLPPALSQISNFTGVWQIEFSTNYSLRLFVLTSGGKQDYHTLTAHGEKESLLDYLALGDSFASGEGTFDYKPATDVRSPYNGCHLSRLSYPYLLASKTNLSSVQSVACSGAKLKDVINANYTEPVAQAKGRADPSNDDQILNDYLPGYRPQINFVDRSKPGRITISVLGNDIGFSNIILGCLAPDTCYNDPQERLNLAHTINSKFNQLVGSFAAVKTSAASAANIYVLGYPSLAVPNGNCAVNVRLNPDEITFSNQLISYLNSVVRQAAAKAGVTYVDIEDVLAGYRLCETKSSQVAVNGLTAGDDKTFSLPIGDSYTLDGYFSGKESYHPNQLGHRLYAERLAAATNNFLATNPAANINVVEPSLAAAKTLTDVQAPTAVPQKILFEDSLTTNLLLRNNRYPLVATGLQPGSTAVLKLGLRPVAAATYVIGSNGQLNTSFDLPGITQTGFNTIHLYGKNSFGEDIDVQKVVYLAATATDIDGDGTPNNQELCLVGDPAVADQDGDGTDDACDPYVGEPPLTVLPIDPETVTAGASLSQQQATATPTFLQVSSNKDVIPAGSPDKQPARLTGLTLAKDTATPSVLAAVSNTTPGTPIAEPRLSRKISYLNREKIVLVSLIALGTCLVTLSWLFRNWRKRA